MKRVLVSSFDMEVGGVERSLVSMLNNFDYDKHQVDLMLYSHSGEFMTLLNNRARLLDEVRAYKTFRLSIGDTIKRGEVLLAAIRLLAKSKAAWNKSPETGYKQMQYMWKYSLPFLPKADKEYDIAISYLWPHYFIAYKVKAKQKIAWIHTDFSTVDTDVEMDLAMWDQFDHIVAVSDGCRASFITKYPSLAKKVLVIENITSPELVTNLAAENEENLMKRDHRFKIITVARFSYAKGIDQAINALKLLKDKGVRDIAWYVVGYGGDQAELEKLVASHELHDSFIFLGKKTNPYPYMKEADLYVQPSRYEGKAVTVGEAQILGKPVMITNYPTAVSQVTHGVNGYICELSVQGIADGIYELYMNELMRRSIGNRCKNTDYRNTGELEKLYTIM
ncbi:glycosyltransferase [Salipaludibacillus sp. CUR1]|uniref:glycosyltransferase n=1 Tax=Salipaludibacillus sp. CUR1 TaxID=2820003 RepID=UPI001E2A36DA|nr:glycosyltransferase [Salipaludibacillus sp. CUR1]MCE7792505.1 glycosyltransferase [Salipaludibacillus sp. CUR1]